MLFQPVGHDFPRPDATGGKRRLKGFISRKSLALAAK